MPITVRGVGCESDLPLLQRLPAHSLPGRPYGMHLLGNVWMTQQARAAMGFVGNLHGREQEIFL